MCSRTIAMLILDFMKFEVSEYNFPDFLARRFMFVVRLLLEQAAVGSSFPLGMLAYSAHRGVRDSRMHRCVARTTGMLTLDSIQFEVYECWIVHQDK